jgi:hypothetical protein
MKKIMFSERFGLEQAVLAGTKTMTRRIIPDIEIDWNRRGRVTLPVSGFEHGVLFMDVRSILHDAGICDYSAPAKYQPKYEVGEEVAIAQSYKDLWAEYLDDMDNPIYKELVENFSSNLFSAGHDNKMFVKADLMPHGIRITDIKAERLQDISDEEAMREGVLEAPFDGYHVTGIGMTAPKSMARPIGQTADGKPVYGDRYRDFKFDSPREAFAALIDRISGRGTWQRNPWVYAYEFELIK